MMNRLGSPTHDASMNSFTTMSQSEFLGPDQLAIDGNVGLAGGADR